MSKKVLAILALLLLLLLVIVGLGFTKFSQISAMIASGETFQEPPIAISSFEVREESWQSSLSSIGTLEAAEGLLITSDLSGRVAKIHFDAGQEVKAGDLLIEQDTSSEQAQLRAAQASAELARNTRNRTRELFEKRVASQSQYDDAQSNYSSAIAEVDNIRATIEKKNIRAPFDGQLGLRLVDLGQTISAGQSVVSLQATQKMYINFFLPQQNLPEVRVGLPVSVQSDAVPGKTFKGVINAIEPEIDAATRSVKIQALLDNPERELLPGMFASIEVIQPDEDTVLLIPVTAVQYATYGDSVFIIEPKAAEAAAESADNSAEQSAEVVTEEEVSEEKVTEEVAAEEAEAPPADSQALQARQQFVKLGEMRGDFIQVEKGLEAGQLVASAGVFKLRTGAPVMINNSTVPDFQLDPTVADK